jgi:hypothetical protein
MIRFSLWIRSNQFGFLLSPTRMACLISMLVACTSMNAAEFGEVKFRQLEEILPTPNTYRTASGAPGNEYWQQRADYDIQVELDDERQRIIGSEKIHYTNNSPDALDYLWVQIDANLFAKNSDGHITVLLPISNDSSSSPFVDYSSVRNSMGRRAFIPSKMLREPT